MELLMELPTDKGEGIIKFPLRSTTPGGKFDGAGVYLCVGVAI